ncbi:tetratricopeptide repeat protein [Vibrio sonorensis]|uniref:tetratricopeptide repeat protein n=1 Tax=Vibrio sonorensis TaxID=1004316 RepID=UPI0008D8FBC7|nr:tetratricopeptide repeat protein [Vibrio sonorensis]
MSSFPLFRSLVSLLACSVLIGCASQQKVNAHTENNEKVLAEAAFNYGQFAKAEEQYLRLLAQSPNKLEYQLMLARSQYNQDKKEAAIAKLQHVVLSDDPVAAQASMYLGRYLLSADRVEESITVYELGLSKAILKQTKAQIHNGLGIALLASNLPKARRELSQAVQLAPDNPHYRSNLALSFLQDNKLKQAREAFQPLLSYQHLPVQVELNFALLLLAEGNENQARALLARHLPASEVERDLTLLKDRLSNSGNVL